MYEYLEALQLVYLPVLLLHASIIAYKLNLH